MANISEKIYEELKKRLQEGEYPPGSKFPAESQLADEFGVSKITMNKIVSLLAGQGYLIRGVRGAGTRVSPERFRARGNIGVIAKLSPFSIRIIKGIQQECQKCGCLPIVFSPETEELQYVMDMLASGGCSGIISIGYGLLPPPPGMQVCCLDHPLQTASAAERGCFINSDNYSGGRAMMTEIILRGHRNAVVFSAERFVCAPDAPVTSRIRGFWDAMQESGIRDCGSRIFYAASGSVADAENALKNICTLFPETTAVCCDSDTSAELLFRAACGMKLDLLQRFAVTGFGNVTSLPIATVDQQPEQQGRLAVRRLAAPDHGRSFSPETLDVFLVNTEYIPFNSRI